MSVEKMVARLKAEAARGAAEELAAGKAAGARWAESRASARELKRLARAVRMSDRCGAGLGSAQEYVDLVCNGLNHGTFVQLALDITGDQSLMPAKFWREVLGEEDSQIEEEDFAVGFIEGALAAWESARGQL